MQPSDPRQVDDLPVTGQVLGDVERRLAGANRRVHAMPRGRQRPTPRVVGCLRELVEVQPRRLAAELAGRARIDVDCGAELVVLAQEVSVHAGVFVTKRLPLVRSRRGGRRAAAADRGRASRAGCTTRCAPRGSRPARRPGTPSRCPSPRRPDVPRPRWPSPLVAYCSARRASPRSAWSPSRSARSSACGIRRGDADELGPGILGGRAAVHLGCVDRVFGPLPSPGDVRKRRSSNPRGSSTPAKDSSMTNTTRCPRSIRRRR